MAVDSGSNRRPMRTLLQNRAFRIPLVIRIENIPASVSEYSIKRREVDLVESVDISKTICNGKYRRRAVGPEKYIGCRKALGGLCYTMQATRTVLLAPYMRAVAGDAVCLKREPLIELCSTESFHRFRQPCRGRLQMICLLIPHDMTRDSPRMVNQGIDVVPCGFILFEIIHTLPVRQNGFKSCQSPLNKALIRALAQFSYNDGDRVPLLPPSKIPEPGLGSFVATKDVAQANDLYRSLQ